MELSELRDLVRSFEDAVMALDADGRIVAWNEAAHRLLGYSERETVGRFCWSVVQGSDVFGNSYCNPHCPLLETLRAGKPIRPFDLCAVAKGGELKRLCCTSHSIRGGSPGDSFRIHHFVESPFGIGTDRCASGATPAGRLCASGEAPCPSLDTPLARFRRLGPREVEVLRGLAAGLGTSELARRLFISATTVRKHVQAVLRKLEVHGRLAAVIYAQEHGLL